MKDETKTTLDYINDITVSGNPFTEPTNEYYALLCLRNGLDFLFRQAVKCDQIAQKQLDPKKKTFIFGNIPGIPYELLTCTFHWYSVSACQYVGTVGTIAYLQDDSRPIPPEYIKTVIPEILAYRDKIGAHYAWSKKSKKDNEAEKLASIIPQVSFFKDTFQVQGFRISKTSGGKSSSSEALQPWSIVNIHQLLQKRYWPDEI